ncbi:di-trans,poly-cis-decaprenylcistransferase [Patescibacteria group bacterium]|nr:di-trans,poly-cis-decaprenylcistransferase [Patescibacteria group bacterium]
MKQEVPKHIGIILDGNRRWAKAKNLSSLEGHRQGFSNVKKITRYTYSKGIKILSIYAFSTENWNRSKEEVSYLMGLFKLLLTKEINALNKEGVKINIFGRISDFDDKLKKLIVQAQDKTSKNNKAILNICISYGGRDEIVRAVKKIVEQNIPANKITEELISQNLDSANIPDPDLIIRTSGELRLSGFLTWQSVYSELYFPKVTWPDFSEKDLDLALEEYNKRQRRFGAN